MDRYITKKSIEGLILKLDLPTGDKYSQDWEIEIASADIAIKVLTAYIDRNDLTEDERFTLMRVIIESVNDYISEYDNNFPLLEVLKQLLRNEYSLHSSTLDHWACWDQEDLDETFEITPIIRAIVKGKSER